MQLNKDKINVIKAERGLNNTDISRLTGISRNWLGIIFERGYSTPQIIGKLAKGLEIEVE